mgnify:FL=1
MFNERPRLLKIDKSKEMLKSLELLLIVTRIIESIRRVNRNVNTNLELFIVNGRRGEFWVQNGNKRFVLFFTDNISANNV